MLQMHQKQNDPGFIHKSYNTTLVTDPVFKKNNSGKDWGEITWRVDDKDLVCHRAP